MVSPCSDDMATGSSRRLVNSGEVSTSMSSTEERHPWAARSDMVRSMRAPDPEDMSARPSA